MRVGFGRRGTRKCAGGGRPPGPPPGELVVTEPFPPPDSEILIARLDGGRRGIEERPADGKGGRGPGNSERTIGAVVWSAMRVVALGAAEEGKDAVVSPAGQLPPLA